MLIEIQVLACDRHKDVAGLNELCWIKAWHAAYNIFYCFCIFRLKDLHVRVCTDKTLPDETLYGRVGYLYSLLFVTHHLGEETVDPEIIIKVIICLFF